MRTSVGGWLLSLLLVGFVALAVAWLGDPRAASFSDAGGRLATVKTMADDGRWVPDLGYWAGPVDPDGSAPPDPASRGRTATAGSR